MQAPVDYLLHLADNALILGQRNAEWCGHGPILEEDIALSNNSLDLIGQARMLYQHAATLQGGDATEDTLAYFRDVPDFKNYTLCELPHMPLMAATSAGDRDFATTIVRNFFIQQPDGAGVGPIAKLARRAAGRHRRQVAQRSALPPAPLARLAGQDGRRHR
jgi:1,2-phenylacetyl-CoA epoxidase catalytic subunit